MVGHQISATHPCRQSLTTTQIPIDEGIIEEDEENEDEVVQLALQFYEIFYRRTTGQNVLIGPLNMLIRSLWT